MRIFYSLIFPGLWFAFVAYWTVAATRGKTIERRETWLSRISYSLPLMIGIGFLWIPPSLGGPLFDRFLPRGHAPYWIGAGLTAIGLGFAIWARHRLGGNWSGTVTVKADHELIRSGPYEFVRHPIYTGLVVAFLGTAIAIGQWRGLITVAIVTVAFIRKLTIEERWMQETFGDQYARYKHQVRALIPFVY